MQWSGWRLAAGGMIALGTGMGVGRFVYTPILPVMAEALGLSTSEAGLIASANFLGHLVGALLAALPLFKGSRYRYLIAALAINVVGLVAMGLTVSFAAHIIIRFLAGVAGAFIVIFSSALILDRLAAMGKAGLSSLHFGGIGIGIAVSAAFVAWLLEQGAVWADLWFASAAICLGGLALSARLIPSAEPADGAPRPMPGGTSTLSLNAMIAAYGLFGFGYVITATFIVAIVRDAPALAAMEPYIWAVFGLSAAPSVAFWMIVKARLGLYHAFALAAIVEALGVAGSILSNSPVGVVVAVMFLGGTMTGITALGLIAVRDLTRGDPRANIALATAAFGAGQMIGPTFAGLMVDWLGSFVIPSLIAAATLLVAAGLSWLALAYRPPETSSIAPAT